jgi:ribonuclease P protein component
MRFGPDRRVRKRPEFLDLTARGVRVATPHFVLLAAKQAAGSGPSRLGITASRRVGNAIVRNRLKRLAREAFRALSGVVPEGHDLLVICRHGGASSAQQVILEWERARPKLLQQLGRAARGGQISEDKTRA